MNKYDMLHTQFSPHNCNLTQLYVPATHWLFQYTKYVHIY